MISVFMPPCFFPVKHSLRSIQGLIRMSMILLESPATMHFIWQVSSAMQAPHVQLSILKACQKTTSKSRLLSKVICSLVAVRESTSKQVSNLTPQSSFIELTNLLWHVWKQHDVAQSLLISITGSGLFLYMTLLFTKPARINFKICIFYF